mgnify:CR=1 FL=1
MQKLCQGFAKHGVINDHNTVGMGLSRAENILLSQGYGEDRVNPTDNG